MEQRWSRKVDLGVGESLVKKKEEKNKRKEGFLS